MYIYTYVKPICVCIYICMYVRMSIHIKNTRANRRKKNITIMHGCICKCLLNARICPLLI